MFRLSRRSTVPFVALATLAAATPVAGQDGRNDILARSGTAVPDGDGTFEDFSDPTLNDAGQAAFSAFLDGTDNRQGVFRGDGGAVTQLARRGQAAPDGDGSFEEFGDPTLNGAGQAAFRAFLSGNPTGVFRGDDDGVTQLARAGQAAPGGGEFDSFSEPALNGAGQAGFRASLTGGGAGIFRGDDDGVTQLARAGQAAPGGGTFSSFSSFADPTLNDAGQAGFRAFLTGGGAGIFRGDGDAVTRIARTGQDAPGGGTYEGFLDPTLNNAGQAAFKAFLTGNDSGIFRGDGGILTQIAREGQAAPDDDGTFTGFGDPALNASGQAAFQGFLTGTDSSEGVFRGDGGALTQIARQGQTAPGGSGTLVFFGTPVLNATGQAAFSAFLDVPGEFDGNTGFFTGDGIDLLTVVRVGDSLAGSTIDGLFLDDSNNFDREVSLNDFGQVAYRARLTDGREVVSRWTPDLHYRGGATGSFEDANDFTLGLDPTRLQNGTAIYDVFLDPDFDAVVAGPAGDATLKSLTVGGGDGQVTLALGGGELTATEGLFLNGNGDVTLGPGGSLQLADLALNGELFATAGSTVTVTGLLSGDGDFLGGGTLEILGELRPGNSPGALNVVGNLVTAASTITGIELGGLLPGVEFDRIDVNGDVTLAGILEVSLFGGFVPAMGDVFEFLNVTGTRTGMFAGLGEGAFVGTFGGTDLFITYTNGDGNDVALLAGPAAVPEPGSLLLFGLVAGGAAAVRRRRGRIAADEAARG